MSAVILVVGEGLLADRVCGDLSTQYEVIRRCNFEAGVPETTDLVLVLHDTLNPSIHKKAEEVLRPTGIPWMRGFVSYVEGVIGPLVRPDIPGCSRCADKRRIMAGRDRKEMWEMEQRRKESGEISSDPWASRTGLLQMAHLLESEIQSVLDGDQAHSVGRLCLLDLKSLKSSWHSFLPDPLCPVCNR